MGTKKGTMLIDTVHIVAFTFGFIMILLAEPGCSLFSYHPSLMSLGLMIFALEAIVQMKDTRIPAKYKIAIHWIMQTIGISLGYIGFAVIYINKEQLKKHHYVTWHGFFGLVTTMLLTLQWSGGWAAKHSVGLSKITGIKRTWINKVHKFTGVIASMAIAFTVYLALYSTWFLNTISSDLAWYIMLGLLAYPRLYFFVRKLRGIDPWV